MNKRLILILFFLCAFNVHAQSNAVLNKDGSFVTGVLTASFDPQAFPAWMLTETPWRCCRFRPAWH